MEFWRINDLFHSGRSAGPARNNKTTKHRGALSAVQKANNVNEVPGVTPSPSSSSDDEKDSKASPGVTGSRNVTFKRGGKPAATPWSSDDAAFKQSQSCYFRSFAEFGFRLLANSVRLGIAELMKVFDTTSNKATECVDPIKNSAKKARTSLGKHGSCIENAGRSIERAISRPLDFYVLTVFRFIHFCSQRLLQYWYLHHECRSPKESILKLVVNPLRSKIYIRELALSSLASSDGSGAEQVSKKVESGELGTTAKSLFRNEIEDVEKQLHTIAKMTRARFIEDKEFNGN